MSSDRAEFSDAEIDGDSIPLAPSVGQLKRKKITSKGTPAMPGANSPAASRRDGSGDHDVTDGDDGERNENRHKKRRDSREPQRVNSTTISQDGLNSYWLLVIAGVILAVVAWQQITIWNLQSKIDDSSGPIGGPVVSYDLKYASKKEFEQEKKNVKKLEEDFENRKPQNHEWDDVKEKTDKIGTLQERVEQLETQSKEFAEIKNEIEEEFGEVKKDRKLEKVEHQNLQTNVVDMNVKIGTQETLVQEVKEKLTGFEGKYDADKKETESRIKKQEEEFKRQVDDLEQANIKKLKDIKEALERDFGKKLDSLDPLVQEVKGKVDNVLMPNAFNKQNVIIAFFLLVLILGLVMLSMKNKGKATSIGNPGPVVHRNGPASTLPQNPILNEVPPNRPLQNQLCVVSYGDNIPYLHVTLVEKTLEGLSKEVQRKCPLVYHTIRKHEQIVQLPPVKLYLVFIHFSERHVIIEEPFIGQGDIRRTTVQAITKLGGDYIIVYVKDPGSQGLPPNCRYNRDIYIVKRQAELIALNQRGRFFSVYNTITDFQRDCIQAIITDTFAL